MAPAQPELKKYIEKRVSVQLNGSRRIQGVLRGYDVFLNLTLDDAVEIMRNDTQRPMGQAVIRGNAVVMIEALERIGDDNRGGGRG